ncbi:Capsule polysaccharide export protein KpsS [Nymphon striatum]|nr:Capsule polysaccharide export protein KpsS [Nymphon striatum]
MKYSLITLQAISIALTAIVLSGCNPVSYNVSYDNVSFDPVNRRTVVSAIDSSDRNKIERLTYDIMSLGPNVDKNEAQFVAREAVLYAQHLANEYKLMGPPNFHNVLVNSGQRKRGLCYHWAQDMDTHMVKNRTYETLTLTRVVANQGNFVEHNVLTVAAKGKGIKDAFILDAWRHSGDLIWMKTGDDSDYDWVKYTPQYSNKVATPNNQKNNFKDVHVDKKGSTVVKAIDSADNQKIDSLYNAIMTLGSNIEPSEAQFVAREAVLYPKVLANRYKLASPPLYHNVLVNYGRRPRGLCYQWTHDMGKQINRPMKSLQFFHGVAFRRNYWKEHSTLVVAAKGKGVPDGIVLDPWRNSGNLFWSRVKDDKKYPWVQLVTMSSRSFLFLQGVASPFFTELGKSLVEAGHEVSRINFCGGDYFFSKPFINKQISHINYRGSLESLHQFLETLLTEKSFSDIVLFGDTRPIHQAAIDLARQKNIDIHVFEEGYIRPYWITLDKEGVNANSKLSKDPQWYKDFSSSNTVSEPLETGKQMRPRAWHDIRYHLSGFMLKPLFSQYSTHRPDSPLTEYIGWIKRFPRISLLHKKQTEEIIHKLVFKKDAFYVLPLQLNADAQMREHSPIKTVLEVIETTINSFSNMHLTTAYWSLKTIRSIRD